MGSKGAKSNLIRGQHSLLKSGQVFDPEVNMNEISFFVPEWLAKLNDMTYLKFAVARRNSNGHAYYALSYAAKGNGLFPRFIFEGSSLSHLKMIVTDALRGIGYLHLQWREFLNDPFNWATNIELRLLTLKSFVNPGLICVPAMIDKREYLTALKTDSKWLRQLRETVLTKEEYEVFMSHFE